MANPFYKGFLASINQEAVNLFLGKKSFAEAVDAAYNTFEEIVDSPEFQVELKKYYDKFVEVDAMNDVVTLYEIVPVDSGITYIAYDEAIDYYYRVHKGETDKNSLVFDTKEAAEKYIQTYFPMSANAYKVEEFGYSLSKAPFKIRTFMELG